jgi:hypothetical protein
MAWSARDHSASSRARVSMMITFRPPSPAAHEAAAAYPTTRGSLLMITAPVQRLTKFPQRSLVDSARARLLHVVIADHKNSRLARGCMEWFSSQRGQPKFHAGIGRHGKLVPQIIRTRTPIGRITFAKEF